MPHHQLVIHSAGHIQLAAWPNNTVDPRHPKQADNSCLCELICEVASHCIDLTIRCMISDVQVHGRWEGNARGDGELGMWVSGRVGGWRGDDGPHPCPPTNPPTLPNFTRLGGMLLNQASQGTSQS